jgi:hypothetical protein
MARWIVFDQVTASELRSRLPHESVFEAPGRAALEYALDNPKSMVTVLPAPSGNYSTIAVFRPGRTLSTQPANTLPVRPTGILGLNDESLLEGMQEETRRWWQFWKE